MGDAAEDIVDTTFYPVREKVGEELLQRLIMEVLRPLVEALLASRGRVALVGADQFFYWEQFNPRKAVAPDVYVLDGVDPKTVVTAWKVWETGIVPSFCFEVVARDGLKDYEDAPKRYAELGVQELVIFDPHSEGSSRRVRWQVLRRVEGELLLVHSSDSDRVRSEVLDAWLRQVGSGQERRVRVAIGEQGDELVPTDAERAEEGDRRAHEEARRAREEAGRAQEEARRAQEEARRAQEEARRAARAEEELRVARAELERLRKAAKGE